METEQHVFQSLHHTKEITMKLTKLSQPAVMLEDLSAITADLNKLVERAEWGYVVDVASVAINLVRAKVRLANWEECHSTLEACEADVKFWAGQLNYWIYKMQEQQLNNGERHGG